MASVETVVQSKVTAAVVDTIQKPSVDAQMSAANSIITAVVNNVLPIILNSTNNEPWYMSRVLWGQIVNILGIICALLGLTLGASAQTMIVSLMPSLVGAGITIYGRFRAKKPIGS